MCPRICCCHLLDMDKERIMTALHTIQSMHWGWNQNISTLPWRRVCYNPLLKSVLVFNMISVCSWSRALIYMSTALSNYNLIQFRQKERIFQVWKENILTSLKMARIRRNKNFPDSKIFNVKTFRKKARKSSVNWSYCWWIKGRFLEAVVVQRETALGRLHKKKSYSTTSFTNKWLLAIYCNAMHKVNSGFPNL